MITEEIFCIARINPAVIFAFNTMYLYIMFCLYVNLVAVCNNLLSFSDRVI